MGRGVGWTDVELSDFARGWIYAIEDGIAGIYQNGARFRETMFKKYKTLAPTTSADKSYGARSAK